jgi:hypothetical protein
MLSAWRIVKARHAAAAFTGEGARLVHLGSSVVLRSYVLICCDFDEALVTEVDAKSLLRIPAKLNADSGHCEHGFRASRSLIGAKRREQLWS